MTILLLGITWLASSAYERHSREQLREQVQLVARAVQLPLGHALARGRPGAVSEVLRSLSNIRRLYSIVVYDRGGSLIAHIGRAEPPADLDVPPAAQLGVGGEDRHERVGDELVYSYMVPITASAIPLPLGTLQVTRRAQDIQEYTNIIRWRGIGLGLGAIVLVGCVVWVGHRRAIGRPMAAMDDDIQRIEREPGHHRVAIYGPAEVRRVGTSINRMLDAIHAADLHLEARRQREIELERQVRQREKLAVLGQLAGGVAHEIGTPLSVIDGHAQRLLRSDELADPDRAKIGRIRREVERVSAIVRELLEMGRDSDPEFAWTSVERIAVSAAAAVKPLCQERDVAIDLDGPARDARIYVYGPRIERALINLLRNAVQASPSGGEVRFAWSVEGTSAHFVVRDFGAGIPDELRRRIVEPFFTTKPVGEGTGLGLAVVQGIAEASGGVLEFFSPGGGGTEVHLRLPGVTPAPGDAEKPPTRKV